MIKAINIIFFLFIVILPYEIIRAQTDSLEFLQDEILSPYNISEETDYSQYSEMLEEQKNNPVDINHAELFGLLNIPGIDHFTAEAILNYIKTYGRIFSLSELYLIKDVDKLVIRRIIPYLTLRSDTAKDTTSKPAITDHLRTEGKDFGIVFRSRLITGGSSSNDENNLYPGGPQKIYNRLIYSGNNLKAAIVFEKDKGERKLNDFTSFYVSLNKLSFVDKLILGDYLFEFGQGLALGRPFGVYKSNEISSSGKPGRGLVPYSGSEENRFFSGMAAAFDLHFLRLTAFYSSHKFDAASADSTGLISSLVLSGYHRTASEIHNEDAGSEICTGVSLDIKADSLVSFGILASNSVFGPELALKAMNNRLVGKYSMYSLSYRFYLGNTYVTGEIARSMGRTSFINVIQKEFAKSLSLVLSLRSYSEGFPYIHSGAFGENSGKAENETGFFFALKYNSTIGRISFYHDRFSPQVNRISSGPGNETSLIYQNSFDPGVMIKCKYKNKAAQYLISFDGAPASSTAINTLTLEARYPAPEAIDFVTRFNFSHLAISVPGTNETGFGLSQEFKYQRELLEVFGRITYFNTDSFFSGIREYEFDLPGVFSVSNLFGEGLKWYLLVKYSALEFMTISMKYSETYAIRKSSIASGLDQVANVDGNILSLQLDLRL